MKKLNVKKVGKAIKKIKAGKSLNQKVNRAVYVKDGMLYCSNNELTLGFNIDAEDGLYRLDMIENGILVIEKEERFLNDWSEDVKDFYKDVDFKHEYKKLNKAQETLFKAQVFASKDTLRPIMMGVLVEKDVIVATNAHVLFFERGEYDFAKDNSFIIPSSAVEFLKVFKKESIEIFYDGEKYLHFNFQCGFLKVRVIDGQYPKWEAIVPQSNDKTATVDKKNILKTLKELKPFLNKYTRLVKLHFYETHLTISAEDVSREVEHEIDIPCKAKVWGLENEDGVALNEFVIAFNHKYLEPLINTIDEDDVVIEMLDNSKIILINGNRLITPLMIK